MRLLLGTPDSDRDGCLQDIHWYDGAWGYFRPTLGALIAAQLFAAARTAHDIDDAIATGDFTAAPLLHWLRTIHARGSSLSTEELPPPQPARRLLPTHFVTTSRTLSGLAFTQRFTGPPGPAMSPRWDRAYCARAGRTRH